MSATQVPLVHLEIKFLSSHEFKPMNSNNLCASRHRQTISFQKGEIEKKEGVMGPKKKA